MKEKTTGVRKEGNESSFYEKILKKQLEVQSKKEDDLKKMLFEDFGKDEGTAVFKRFGDLFKYCEAKGKNEEAQRIMEDDYSFFDEILQIIRERSKVDVNLSVGVKKINEEIQKEGKDLEKKIVKQKNIIFELLKESIKYKMRMDKYEKIVSEIMFRKRFNALNESAIKDFEGERKAGQKLVDMVMSKRLRAAVDYGNFMGKLSK